MKKYKGKIIIISGPSRIGKDVIVNKLLQHRGLKLSGIITYTTRPKRIDEKNGREHIFVTLQYFKKMIRRKKLLEWKWFAGQRYGTPKEKVLKKISIGKNVLLNIETQGALKIKKQLANVLTIFITAESNKEIKRRIFSSDKLTTAQKKLRWNKATKELKVSRRYDYMVINKWGKLNQTVRLIKKIIINNL